MRIMSVPPSSTRANYKAVHRSSFVPSVVNFGVSVRSHAASSTKMTKEELRRMDPYLPLQQGYIYAKMFQIVLAESAINNARRAIAEMTNRLNLAANTFEGTFNNKDYKAVRDAADTVETQEMREAENNVYEQLGNVMGWGINDPLTRMKRIAEGFRDVFRIFLDGTIRYGFWRREAAPHEAAILPFAERLSRRAYQHFIQLSSKMQPRTPEPTYEEFFARQELILAPI